MLSYLKIADYVVVYRHICFKLLYLLGFHSAGPASMWEEIFLKALESRQLCIYTISFFFLTFFKFSALCTELIYNFYISQVDLDAGRMKSREGQNCGTNYVVCTLGLSIFAIFFPRLGVSFWIPFQLFFLNTWT